MRVRDGALVTVGYMAFLLGSVGCGSVRETLPARSAMEQLMISTAADRAVGDLPDVLVSQRKVYLESANLDCLDKAYVVEKLRSELLASGAVLTKTADDAELIVEVASGAMSLNKRDMLLGVPAVPLPIPYAGETLKLPEIPLWKTLSYTGHAKLLLCVVDARSGRLVEELPTRYGQCRESLWWLLLVGPFRRSDMPEEAR